MNFTKFRTKPYNYLLAVFVVVVLAAVGIALPGRQAVQSIELEQPVQQVQQEAQSEPVNNATAVKSHTIVEGETLGAIAEKYGIDVDTIIGANPDVDETNLHPGDKLVILPQKGVLYTTDMGDTLWSIANTYGIDVAAIMRANNKTSEDLTVGEKLFLPGAKPAKKTETMVARAEYPVSRDAASVSRFYWPAHGELSSRFGYRWGRLHAGIDIANDIGTPVSAAMSGRVTYAGWESGYGYTIVIEHSRGYETLYGHLSGFAVGTGQYVRAGQVIAYMGNTGNSTGPHVHFEVHKNGGLIDPLTVLP